MHCNKRELQINPKAEQANPANHDRIMPPKILIKIPIDEIGLINKISFRKRLFSYNKNSFLSLKKALDGRFG
jgi:hypothetical protein